VRGRTGCGHSVAIHSSIKRCHPIWFVITLLVTLLLVVLFGLYEDRRTGIARENIRS